MKAARDFVSTDLLLEALAFPEGSRVLACIGERASLGEIELFVEHDDLPDVPKGMPIPIRVPQISVSDADKRPSDFFKFEWGRSQVDWEAEAAAADAAAETAVLKHFYDEVCREAELRMEKTGILEGAHYAALKSVLASKGVKV